MGKHLGAIIPPIGERAIAFTCIVPGRFKAIVDTTEHDGFGYHGRPVLGSLEPVRPITVTLRVHHCAQLVVCKVPSAFLEAVDCHDRRPRQGRGSYQHEKRLDARFCGFCQVS